MRSSRRLGVAAAVALAVDIFVILLVGGGMLFSKWDWSFLPPVLRNILPFACLFLYFLGLKKLFPVTFSDEALRDSPRLTFVRVAVFLLVVLTQLAAYLWLSARVGYEDVQLVMLTLAMMTINVMSLDRLEKNWKEQDDGFQRRGSYENRMS